jgi:hypothetical protein
MDLVLFDSVPKSKSKKFQQYIKSLSGLIAYYPLDETSGDVINRAPSTFGTLNGTPVGVTQGVSGLLGKAYSFDGVNDYVTFNSGKILMGKVNSSVVMIMKSNQSSFGTGGIQMYGERASGGNDIFKLEMSHTTTIGGAAYTGRDTAGTLNQPKSTKVISDNLYHILTLTKTGTALKIYVDGAEVLSTTLTISDTFTNPDIISGLGREIIDESYYIGLMQHVALYESSLSPAQALRLAQLAGFR